MKKLFGILRSKRRRRAYVRLKRMGAGAQGSSASQSRTSQWALLPAHLNPAERSLIYFLGGAVVLANLALGLGSWMILAPEPTDPVALSQQQDDYEDESLKEDVEHESEAEVSAIAANPIPKAIRKRQDGVQEKGHDLVDPEIGEKRGLAAILKGEIEIELAYRFVELGDFKAGTRASSTGESGVVMARLSLEVSSREAEQELLQRQTEIVALISSLVGEWEKSELRTLRGLGHFKEAVQREVNNTLASGRVTDVLFGRFLVR